MADAVTNDLVHRFHAEATAFHGELIAPLPQKIPPQAQAKLKPEGGYLSQDGVEFRIERIFHLRNSHTQVSGRPDSKAEGGAATLATAVVEGLNILEVVTADRVVAQIATVHPEGSHVPRVTFLGTRFENLRIAGHPVHVELDLDIIGDRPQQDAPYHEHAPLLARVGTQCSHLRSHAALPRAARDRYVGAPVRTGDLDVVEFSLVRTISGNFPGESFGHVIRIPDFGTIYLATVKLHHERHPDGTPPATTIELTMIEAKLGCLADGDANVATAKTNGGKGPP